MMSIGLAIASRTTSKEFADGMLNLVSWPMMVLSEVWFSLEGSSETIKFLSKLLPLTHFVQAARAIMTEGAGLLEIWPNIAALTIFSFVLIAASSIGFKWNPD